MKKSKQNIKRRRQNKKEHYDKTATLLEPLTVNSEVWVNPTTLPQQIKQKATVIKFGVSQDLMMCDWSQALFYSAIRKSCIEQLIQQKVRLCVEKRRYRMKKDYRTQPLMMTQSQKRGHRQ